MRHVANIPESQMNFITQSSAWLRVRALIYLVGRPEKVIRNMAMNLTNSKAFDTNWAFQESYYDQVIRILKQNAAYFVIVTVASLEEDMKHAKDFDIRIEGGDIAVRIRRPYYTFRDLTIRSYINGYKTEIDKLREGWGRYYLYCWTNDNIRISEWILIDMNKVRELKLLDNRKEISNKDGRTRFIAIPAQELKAKDCIMNSLLSPKG